MSIRISVIVPFYNAGPTLQKCLEALQKGASSDVEIIAVDDGSSDDSASIAKDLGVRVIRRDTRGGPAAARNYGVEHAQGSIVFFVDADVILPAHSILQVLNLFDRDPALAAVFGSYDSEPAEPTFLSQYRNLLHHYVHQNSREEAQTFWAGCGAIRTEIFKTIGAFDVTKYNHASIEDIELGHRLWRAKYKIRLEKSLLAKHLKRWTPLSMLKADILYRARPWSKLILESGVLPDDLNLQWSHRLSGMLVALIPLMLLATAWVRHPIRVWLFMIPVVSLMVIFLLNRKLYIFFLKQRGFGFMLLAIPWHLLYYFYSGATFGYYWVHSKLFHTGRSDTALKNAVVK